MHNGEECVICSNKTYLFPVCKKCRKEYFSINKILSAKRCCCCGKELISTQNFCTKCREEPILVHVDKAFPLFSYRLWNKELLFRWKIGGERSLSFFYASLLNDILRQFSIENIVPVPPRKGKIRENGWDQIDELCNLLKFRYNFSVFKLLERNSVVQQKKLNRKERLQTISNAYSLIDYKQTIPDTVCLIDDVCTTGSTIECCAKLLKSIGIKKVYVVTLYIVD